MPSVLEIQVSDVDVVARELTGNDYDVVAQQSVDKKQVGSSYAEKPIDRGRCNPSPLFRLPPLNNKPAAKECLA